MTNGISGKLKLVALITSVLAGAITLVAAIDPDLLTPVAWAAVGGFVTKVGADFGAYWGNPGEVTESIGAGSDSTLSPEALDTLSVAPTADPTSAKDA
jgi:hypothetical protein